MAFPTDPLGVRAKLLIGGQWVDVTSAPVLARDKVRIRRGRPNEASQVDPSQCELSIWNPDGKYSPRNPLSPYFGLLGRNTPLRVEIPQPTTPQVRSVSSAAANGPLITVPAPAGVVAGDVLLAFHSGDRATDNAVPMPSGGTWTLLATQDLVGPFGTAELHTHVWWRRADDDEPASYAFGQHPNADGVAVVAAVIGARVPVVASQNYGAPGSSFPTPSVLPVSDHDLELRFAVGDSAPGVTWTPPAGFTEHADLQSNAFTAASLASRTLASDAATGEHSFTASSSAMEVGHGVTVLVSSANVRLCAEIASLPQRWRTPDVWVPVLGQGILTRLEQGSTPVVAPIRRTWLDAGVLAYWPLDDGRNTTQFASALLKHQAAALTGAVRPASDGSLAASTALPVVQGTTPSGVAISAVIPSVGITDQWQVEFFVKVDDVPGSTRELIEVSTTGTGVRWVVSLTTDSVIHLDAYNSSGTLLGSASRPASSFFGEWAHVRVSAYQNGGDIGMELAYSPVIGGVRPKLVAGNSVAFAGSVGRPSRWAIPARDDAISIGHVGVFDRDVAGGTADEVVRAHWRADVGYSGEPAGRRFLRLCNENGVPVRIIGDPLDTEPMGPQRIAALLDLLTDCETTDGGLRFETRDECGLTYLTRVARYNRAVCATLSYPGGDLVDLKPDEDDRLIRNDVTVERRDGSSAHAVQETGPLSIKDPPDGVGRYEKPITVDTEGDHRLFDIATWQRHLGTWDEPRYTAVKVDLAKLCLNGKAALAEAVADIDIGERLTIGDPPVWLPPDEIDIHAEGYVETLDAVEWTLQYTTSPAGPWQVGEYGEADPAGSGPDRYSPDDMALHASIGTADMTLWVRPRPGGEDIPDNTSAPFRWTTDPDDFTPEMQIRIGGEVMSVSAIVNDTSFVGVGAVAHADWAAVTPGLPAGIQPNDQMFLLASTTGAGTPDSVSGWSEILSSIGGSNAKVYRRTATGSESAPTVTFSGGTTGDATSAQICAFRGVAGDRVGFSASQSNAAAQNIDYPQFWPVSDVVLVLLVAHKNDDWTSVSAPAGFTEIDEPDTTLGSGPDQGIYWAYQLRSDRGTIPEGSIVVTGGVAAVSGARLLAYQGLQKMTVTRSVNGVVKSHPAGAEIRLAKEAVYAQ